MEDTVLIMVKKSLFDSVTARYIKELRQRGFTDCEICSGMIGYVTSIHNDRMDREYEGITPSLKIATLTECIADKAKQEIAREW